jgi:uncharacterized damage-inducible protein DinB
MYTAQSLLDIHSRSHQSLSKLLVHCSQFSIDEINCEMAGFGYPTIRLQLHHSIGAEEYWIGVLKGHFDDEDDSLYPTVDSLESYRQRIFNVTEEYLHSASSDELNTPRKMITWQNKERILIPAHVIMRTQAHLYQHQGQILAMCRQLGKPASGLDFPIV